MKLTKPRLYPQWQPWQLYNEGDGVFLYSLNGALYEHLYVCRRTHGSRRFIEDSRKGLWVWRYAIPKEKYPSLIPQGGSI